MRLIKKHEECVRKRISIKFGLLTLILLLGGISIAGCSNFFQRTSPATPNLEATIAAGVESTAKARQQNQPNIDTPEPVIQSDTPSPLPSTQIAIDFNQLGAMKLANLIAEGMRDLAWLISAWQTNLNQVLMDRQISVEETTSLQEGIRQALKKSQDLDTQAIAFINSFGELTRESDETLVMLAGIITQVSSTLQEMQELESLPISDLKSKTQHITKQAEELQSLSSSWLPQLQDELELNVLEISILKADNVPLDKISAVQRAFEYWDAVQMALQDGSIKRDELMDIASLKVNTIAGLKAHGGVKEQNIIPEMENITRMLAMGELPQVADELVVFEVLLGRRPIFPSSATSMPTGGNIDIQPIP